MTKGVIEILKLFLVGERHCVFEFIDKSNTNTIQWNDEHCGD
jgi:hypothetical protein